MRGSRPPNHEAEVAALLKLADAMARAPEAVLQLLAEIALELTGAESAGILSQNPWKTNSIGGRRAVPWPAI
jgi:hypothetical protein